jgi:DNA-binding transcriptional ArsR family regulator
MTENDRTGEGFSNRALTFFAARSPMTVSHPLPDDLIELIAERFRTLSEPTRIKLLDRLREGEASPLELTELIGTTQQNVSKHLGVLQRAGIVARRKQGNFSYYRIIDEGVFSLCEAVCGSLQQQAESLQQLVGAATT